jgi:DNA invertase Pin-like site-specific DNA recombinase
MMNQMESNLLLTRESKLSTRHHERLAVVYVRQSSAHQVQHHQESTQLQYGLVTHAERFGWPRERILVIDDDQGVSGASSEGRLGFQRLLAEVALDHVGIILGVEMSRLARSCKDWYQLLEVCALFGTLISDLDGLYDPSCYNDRLLLGLKGTMSEAELHVLQQRMWQGALQKARRGELLSKGPVGYVRDGDKLVFDPDEQAQMVTRMVFELFERFGSMHAVLRHFVAEGIRMPVRPASGPNKGQLEWRRANQTGIKNMLTHPVYAGAYVFGQSSQSKKSRQTKRPYRLPRDEWMVLLKDRFPAYITWSQYEENQKRLGQNRSLQTSRGSVRHGRALLSGLLVCGRCGYRFRTLYGGRASHPSYRCTALMTLYGEPSCQHLKAESFDNEVVRLAMLALAPSALSVSCQVANDVQQQRDATETLWNQRLERAVYEAERAARQFHAVEPENRLVARTLEAAWEEKLRAQRELQEQHERDLQAQPQPLTAEDQSRIERLAADVPALWNAETTTDADRKEILREIIDHIVVNIEGDTEWVEARIHWMGGHETYSRFRRPLRHSSKLSNAGLLVERVRTLLNGGLSAAKAAELLRAEGYKTARGSAFSEASVATIMRRFGLQSTISKARKDPGPLGKNEFFISELTRELQIGTGKVYGRISNGTIPARRAKDGRWVVTVDEAMRRELMKPREYQLTNKNRKLPDGQS